MNLQYYCEICNSYIFGGNGLREHRRSQKHAEALKSKIDGPEKINCKGLKIIFSC
jgi:hypothetical protein